MGVSANATDIQTRAADWIFDRHDSESWNAEDQAKLDAWLSESLAHRVAYVRLETMLNRSTRLAALRRAPPGPSDIAQVALPKTRSPLIAVVAVVVTIALTGIGAFTLLLAPKTQTYATALGEHKTVTLADGSRIELNTNTILQVKLGARERRNVTARSAAKPISGSGMTAANPFIVTAAGYRVRDLGTEFSVRNDAAHLEVALVQGRARFESAGVNAQMRPSDLRPGDVVVASAAGVSLRKKSERELSNDLAWRRGLLVFQYTTLADAAAEFNRYNARKLVIADPATGRMTVMGKFPANNVYLFGQVAKSILGVRVEARNDAIVISR